MKEDILKTNTCDVLCFYLKIDGDLVGSSEVTKINSKQGFYSRLFVKDVYRGKGYGRKLWDLTQEELDKLGMDLMIEINPYGNLDYDQLKKFYSSEQTEPFEDGLLRRAKRT